MRVENEYGRKRSESIVGERSRLSKLRTCHQPRGAEYASNHDRNCDLSELRMVRPDRNTSCRSSASEEAEVNPFITLRRVGKWQLLVFVSVRHLAHEGSDKFAGDLRIIICTADQACLQSQVRLVQRAHGHSVARHKQSAGLHYKSDSRAVRYKRKCLFRGRHMLNVLGTDTALRHRMSDGVIHRRVQLPLEKNPVTSAHLIERYRGITRQLFISFSPSRCRTVAPQPEHR